MSENDSILSTKPEEGFQSGGSKDLRGVISIAPEEGVSARDPWENFFAEPEPSAVPEGEFPSSQEVVRSFDERHFVAELPGFVTVIDAYPRTNKITQAIPLNIPLKFEIGLGSRISADVPTMEITERDGLIGLYAFLEDAATSEHLGEGLRGIATDMLANLAFIGQAELEISTSGIAAYWESYLDESPDHQLCVLVQISEAHGVTKSDMFVAEKVLGYIDLQKLEKYKGRLITDVGQITADPKDVKIILIDDWMLSGSQITNEYEYARKVLDPEYMDSVEVMFLAAPALLIEHGINYFDEAWKKQENPNASDAVIPVKAYYRIPKSQNFSHMVTGAHSATDLYFETRIGKMVAEMTANSGDESILMPPLTNIRRPYRTMDTNRLKSLSA